MANEFIIKNGFHSKGDSQISGSIKLSLFLNHQVLTTNQTIPATYNGMLASPLSVSQSINLIIETDSTLVIL